MRFFINIICLFYSSKEFSLGSVDPRGFSHESTHFLGASNPSVTPLDGRGYDFMTSRNPGVPQLHCSSSQSLRGPRNSYSHRSTPAFRPSNSMRLGNVSLSEEGIRSVADNFSRHPRLLSATGWRNGDRNRRSRITNERYRSLPDEVGVHDQMDYEVRAISQCRCCWCILPPQDASLFRRNNQLGKV